MKPISLFEHKRTFPVTDFNYHTIDFDALRCSGGRAPRFSDIGREYFATESPRAGRVEALIFAIVGLTALPALIDGVRAASHMLRLIS